MRKRLLIAAFSLAALSLGLGVAAFAAYRLSQQVPEFYQQALRADPQSEQEASDLMLQEATALASEVRQGGDWQAVFTAEQINGWLAVDMVRNHPDLLPRSVSDPRVAIGPEQVRLACRVDRRNWKGVVWLAVDVYLADEPNVIALRIRGARAGVLPLPLDMILDHIGRKADQLDLRIRWRQADGDPVVEIPVPPPRDAEEKVLRIETLQLAEGKVYLSGSTQSRSEGGPLASVDITD